MSFNNDLNYSMKDNVLNKYYKSRGFEIEYVTDLETQKQGIDKFLHVNGYAISIDEKKRRSNFDDLLVETKKNIERNRKGWLYYTKAQYIVYWITPRNKFYIIHTESLRNAVYYNKWHETKNKIITYNVNYKTENIIIDWKDIATCVTSCVLITKRGKFKHIQI